MPSRKTTKAAEAAAAKLPTIPKELIDQFVTGPMSPEAVQAVSMAFKKALIERALRAELSHHLGYPPGAVTSVVYRAATEAPSSPASRCATAADSHRQRVHSRSLSPSGRWA